MTPSIPESEMEKFIVNTGWHPPPQRDREGQDSTQEDVLVFTSKRSLYVIDQDKTITEIVTRDTPRWPLCNHNGILYDGGSDGKIFDTVKGNIVSERYHAVDSLCSHRGSLYSTGSPNGIVDIFTYRIIGGRGRVSNSLCSYQGILYDIAHDGKIRNTMNDSVIARCSNDADNLCSLHGKLFHTEKRGEHEKGEFGVFETISRRCITTRDTRIKSLFPFNGSLYDVTKDGEIHDTFNNVKFLDCEMKVTAMCGYHRKTFVEGGILPP